METARGSPPGYGSFLWLRDAPLAVTRFDATTEADRRELLAAAVTAHRERGSRFLTAEAATVAEPAGDGGDGDGGADADGEGDAADGEGDGGTDATEESGDDETEDGDEPVERVPPWIQFGEGEFNLDCTDEELSVLRTVVDDYAEFRVDQLESPETAAATNVRITAHTSEDRLAAFTERVFREVYGQPAEFRLWVTTV